MKHPARTPFLLVVLFVNTLIGAHPPVQVTTSIAPLAYLAQRIGGERAEVDFLIPTGASPATYAPRPRQLIKLGQADLYLGVGHPGFLFERLHILPMLNNDHSILAEFLTPPATDSHNQLHHDSEHSHGAGDPHLWLSIPTVLGFLPGVSQAMATIDPANAAVYAANLEQLTDEIKTVHQEIANRLNPVQGRDFMVYHPVWGYLAEDFGLNQIAIEQEGKEPGPDQLRQLIDLCRSAKITVVFVQKGFARHSAAAIANQIDGRVVELDPLAYDWITNLRTTAEIIRESIEDE